jgi:hypothetical protein
MLVVSFVVSSGITSLPHGTKMPELITARRTIKKREGMEW